MTHKVSERISFYLENTLDKLTTFKTIKECYSIRSKFVHGQKLEKKYTYEKLAETSSKIDNIVRILLNKVISEDSEIFLKNSTDLNTYFNEIIFK